MGAMAIVGIAAALATRTLTIAEALSGFGNGTVWLVVTAFFIAAGFIKTGLGARIAYNLVARFGAQHARPRLQPRGRRPRPGAR